MKIGFTVGVWDLFHEGHKNFLYESKKHCDYLIVGIMNDFWVRVQKGHEGRPFHSLPLRIQKLREINIADKIVILDTIDMSQYLQIADIWIKGEDQKNMKPDNFQNCIYLKRTPNVSTTSIIQKKTIRD